MTTLKPHRFHILLALADRDLHGTAIVEEVLERTDGALRLWPGMLYRSLRQLEADGLIREVDPPQGAPTEGGRRRFYSLRREGRLRLHEEVERMASLVRTARARRVGDELKGT